MLNKYLKVWSIFFICILCIGTIYIKSDLLTEAKSKPDNSSKKTFVVRLKENSSEELLSRKATFKTKAKENKWRKISASEADLNVLKQQGIIDYVEQDLKRKTLATPNDFYYSNQNNVISGQYDQWNLRKIGLNPTSDAGNSGWKISTGSVETVVAVIDSGIDITNPDLTPNLWINTVETPNNGVDDDGNGFIDDYNGYNFANESSNPTGKDIMDSSGHGTHVSGIIAAATNNNASVNPGIAGVCWTCKIMPLRVVYSGGFAYDSDISDAIYYAVSKGAKVINISLGGPGYSQILEDAVNYAWSNNVLVVTAAGNYNGSANDSYPGGASHTLSIGATNYQDQLAGYSNTGSKIDIVAPGDNILSSFLSGDGCAGTNKKFNCISGTSMAAPHVAGVAALLYTLHKNDATPWNVKDLRNNLLKNSFNLGAIGFDDTFGYGRLDAYSSLNSNTTLTGDSSSPANTLLSIQNPFVSGIYSLNGTVNDPNLYIYTITVKRNSDNAIMKQVSGRSNVVNNTLALLDTTLLTDGFYTINTFAEDFAGNSSTSNSVQIQVDNNPPAAFLLSSPTSGTYLNIKRPNLTWNTTTDLNGIADYELVVNNVAVSSSISGGNYSFVSDLSDGLKSWYVKARDNAGNRTSSNTRTFTIDTAPPSDFGISISTPGTYGVFTFATLDASGISRYEISVDGGTFTQGTSPFSTGTLGDGAHTVTVKAFDPANNTKTSTNTFTISGRQVFLKQKADFNFDGRVELSDLSILASKWQTNNTQADATNDGKTDLSDLSILASNWQKNF